MAMELAAALEKEDLAIKCEKVHFVEAPPGLHRDQTHKVPGRDDFIVLVVSAITQELRR